MLQIVDEKYYESLLICVPFLKCSRFLWCSDINEIFLCLPILFFSLDVHLGCDSKIPLIAQELMKKMIRQFALEYASKCLLHTSTNGVTTRTSSPSSDTSDAPLDLTVSRTTEKKEGENEPGRGSIKHIASFNANSNNGSIFYPGSLAKTLSS